MTTHVSKRTRTAGNASLSLDPIMVDRHMAAALMALMALSEPTIERPLRRGHLQDRSVELGSFGNHDTSFASPPPTTLFSSVPGQRC